MSAPLTRYMLSPWLTARKHCLHRNVSQRALMKMVVVSLRSSTSPSHLLHLRVLWCVPALKHATKPISCWPSQRHTIELSRRHHCRYGGREHEVGNFAPPSSPVQLLILQLLVLLCDSGSPA